MTAGDRMRRARRLLLAAAAVLAGQARAADVQARGDVSWARDDAEGAESRYLRQVYSADYRRQVTPPISLRLSLRFQEDDGDATGLAGRTGFWSRAVTPVAAADYRLEELSLSASWRHHGEARREAGAGATRDRTIDRSTVTLSGRPFEGADATLAFDRVAFSGDSVDTRDDRVGATFRYGASGFRLQSENRLQRFEDGRTGLVRLGMGPRLTAGLAGRPGSAAQLSAQYVLDYFVTEQTARGAAATVAVELEPMAGLLAVDATPDDTAPMTPEPGLVDRSFDVPLAVSLGPSGVPFQNLGLDLGRFTALDELRVHVRSAAGAPVPFGGSVTWTAWTSQDGLRWTAASGATSAFDPSMSAYVVSFSPSTARYFKVVSFGANTVDTQVAELQGFVHEAYQPDQKRRSSAVRHGVTLVAAGRPWAGAQLSLSSVVNAAGLSIDDGPSRWTTDATTALRADLGGADPLRYGVGVNHSLVRQAGGISQDSVAASAGARWRPVARYEATLDARVARDLYETAAPSARARTTSLGLTAGNDAEILPGTRGAASAGVSRQLIDGGGTTDTLSASLQASAPLLRELELRVGASVQRILARRGDTSAQQAIPLLRIATYELYQAELRYHPSPQLSLAARAGYSDAGSAAGLLQGYRASWSPFPGGTVHLAFDHTEEIDPLTGQSFRRTVAAPRWDLNRNASLQLSYNHFRSRGTSATRQQSFYVTFSLRT